MIVLFTFGIAIGIIALVLGAIAMYDNCDKEGTVGLISGALLIILSIFILTYYSNNNGKIQALVESGKYEIVTNEDYSLKELDEFINIGDVYLKEKE